MFAGARRRSSDNVRAMQLFHELKQQFPTVPDHVVSACIATGNVDPDHIRQQHLQPQRPMGGAPAACDTPLQPATPPPTPTDMSDKPSRKRPDTLDLNSLRQSEKCKDVHKLLNAEKPPRSPVTAKRPVPKPGAKASGCGGEVAVPFNASNANSNENVIKKTETAETPTQTTDTLLAAASPSVNVSLNVNCSLDLRSPKRSTVLNVVPQQPWLQDVAGGSSSPRSFTSVNLTLRTPTAEPQAPIDITSQNSSLTYSTSSFDSQKGLQSRLQITVGPTGGSVSSVRTRPRSFHQMDDDMDVVQMHRMGSLPDISTSSVLVKQQARIDKLKIELRSEKSRLVAIQTEVRRLEVSQNNLASDHIDAELEKQLQAEIRHLRTQCEQLTMEVDSHTETAVVPLGETREEYYRNFYTNQQAEPRVPPMITVARATTSTTAPLYRLAAHSNPTEPDGRSPPAAPGRMRPQFSSSTPPTEPPADEGRWSCDLCTFQNHPLLDKCEECEMMRTVHGNNSGAKAAGAMSPPVVDLRAQLERLGVNTFGPPPRTATPIDVQNLFTSLTPTFSDTI